ncbi:hypothetical protein DPMN_108095 [Dreissena polymorpha]|uniref:Uncharacterized protein n=1 Tax=Dreissena polymorpha TaxID=45954 RepID=A0A9D4K882_DREPO|nr:hypothetical protein DPMN_108095 [Dreissena polymorpha]
MPLTSGTTCRRDDPNIGHNVSHRCYSHRAQFNTKCHYIGHTVTQRCPSHRAQRGTEGPSHRANVT